ncbi:hypothetical protein SAMN05421852_102196 [Thermoflavimicrobium dichotomicum]|uniref:Uncharacterized protein n=1 Tax=Thermoflavimicrobium dichotomicum TaxID=46223 RepID=A0A1I3LIF4_9BACL|nr:hypothetical protein SAMN05421852_102196 [Thermoflavimicrobium dichotomicum]
MDTFLPRFGWVPSSVTTLNHHSQGTHPFALWKTEHLFHPSDGERSVVDEKFADV